MIIAGDTSKLGSQDKFSNFVIIDPDFITSLLPLKLGCLGHKFALVHAPYGIGYENGCIISLGASPVLHTRLWFRVQG